MKLKDYQKLVDCHFISPYGGYLIRYWSKIERERWHKFEDIEVDLMKQLTCDFDYKNCVILFPLALGYGETCLFNNRQIVIDHCTYILDIARFLKSKGIIWSNGKKFPKLDQSFPNPPMLIISKGRATTHINSNPLTCAKKVGTKEIFFSGFFIYRLINKMF